MIQLLDFGIGYGSRMLLRHINSDFKEGTLTALIGRNGSGKSTLLRAITGLGQNYDGIIRIEGKNIKNIAGKEFARLLSFVNTTRPRISNMRCRDIVALGRSLYTDWIGNLSDKDRHAVEEALENVGMREYAHRTIDTLSDGECQRVMIARAIAQDTKIIILDEPTSFLDMPNRYEVVSLLKNLSKKHGKTVIFSTHELDIAVDMSDYIALIDNSCLYNMKVEDMIDSGHIQRLFRTPDDFVDRLLKMILEARS